MGRGEKRMPEVRAGVRRQWASDRALQPSMRSPGRHSPSARRSRYCAPPGVGVRGVARRIGRDPGTISRELRRNAATRGGRPVYRALVAQWKAQQAARPRSS